MNDIRLSGRPGVMYKPDTPAGLPKFWPIWGTMAVEQDQGYPNPCATWHYLGYFYL